MTGFYPHPRSARTKSCSTRNFSYRITPFRFCPNSANRSRSRAPPGDVEPERLREILLRVLGRVGADVVPRGDRDAPALEVHPGVVHRAVGLVHLAEGAAEATGAGPVPVVVQEAVAQLVGDETDEHGPGDLVLPPLAHDVALLDLDDLRIARVHARDAGPEQHPVAPVADPAHQQQPAHPGERPGNEVAPGGVVAAPRAGVHPVVHPAAAVGAVALEQIRLVPVLRPPAPGAVRPSDTAPRRRSPSRSGRPSGSPSAP